MNKTREKLLTHVLEEKKKLETLKAPPEYVKTHLIVLNTMEDFITRAEHEHFDEKLSKKLISFYKKLEKLEEAEEKELFHHLISKTLDHELSKEELDKQMHLFGEVMETYHKVVTFVPEKQAHHSDDDHHHHKKKVKEKQKSLTRKIWEDVKGGVEVVDIGRSISKISSEVGLVELLPFALLL